MPEFHKVKDQFRNAEFSRFAPQQNPPYGRMAFLNAKNGA
jgi:hypothetical protein